MKTLICLVLLLLLVACKKQNGYKDQTPPTNTNFFLLDKEGHELITGPATPLRVSAFDINGRYFELGNECNDGGCRMINEYIPGGYRSGRYFYSSGSLTGASVLGVSTWYLTLNGKTDTLYFDLKGIDPGALVPVRPTFNGTPIALDLRLALPAYVLRRRH